MNMPKFTLLFVAVFYFLAGCSNSGGGSSTDTNPTDATNPTDTTNTNTVLYSGFDFNISTNDYWMYRWTTSTKTTSSSGTSIESNEGAFTIWVGQPETIDGHSMYKLEMTGDVYGNADSRITHIGVENNKIIGYDGVNFFTLFDASSGQWPGHALFTSIFDNRLVQVNNYLPANGLTFDRTVYAISQSTNQDQCEYFAGVGTICGDSSYNGSIYEYYMPYVGVAGLYDYYNASFTGGGYDTYIQSTRAVVLLYSSLRGDTIMPEREINDDVSMAQELALPVTLAGSAKADDSGSVLHIYGHSEIEPNDTLATAQVLTAPLDMVGNASAYPTDNAGIVTVNGTTIAIEDIYKVTYAGGGNKLSIHLWTSDGSAPASAQVVLARYDLANNQFYVSDTDYPFFVQSLNGGTATFTLDASNQPDDYYVLVNVYNDGSLPDYNISTFTTGTDTIVDVEDYYKITLDQTKTLHFNLTGKDPSSNKFALYLLGGDGQTLVKSMYPGDSTWTLDAGTYYIGVDCYYSWYPLSIEYTLTVE